MAGNAKEYASDMFENCIFAIITSVELGAQYAFELKEILESNAGVATVVGDEGIDSLDGITHIISNTSDFPLYSDSQEILLPVLTPSWITACLASPKGKHASVRAYTPDPNLFFSNVVITCADVPSGDKEAIIGAVLALGGMESSNLARTTTHICALSMNDPKCQQAQAKHPKVKIILPHWFDDCFKLGKRISEEPYLLPNPALLVEEPEDPVDLPSVAHMQGAISTEPDNINTPTDPAAMARLTIFKKKAVMMAKDLNIRPRIRGIIEELIIGGGGHITTSVHKANIYVCQWRDGRDYIIASRNGIDVGNLSWLYHLITRNAWTSPYRQLLHYPLPKDGIPGFGNFCITLSNYGGEARIYLENLVQACGAEATKNMKPTNTHVITARKAGEKVKAAEEWNIEIVNHLWLEESYAKCQIQSLCTQRYTHFPLRTNLGEVIGKTQLDRKILEQEYYPSDPSPSPSDPKPLSRAAMKEKDQNTPVSRKSVEDIHMADQDDADEEAELPKRKKTAAKPRAKPKSSIVSQLSTPASDRRISVGKENDTPSSTNSRSAKDKATRKLHDMAPDMALYEREKKRKGAVWGGGRAANQIDKEKSLERSSSPADDEGNQSGVEERAPKRMKSVKPTMALTVPALPPVQIRLLITAYTPWVNAPEKEDREKKRLRDYGILVTQDPIHCTHLAAPAMVRTKKFLCALASGPTIVSSEFIDVCLQKGEITSVKDFILKDLANEKKFGLKLRDAVARARSNKRTLLRRVPVYCTEQIPNGADTYKAIAESNGATFCMYRGRGGAMIKPTKPEEDDGPPEPVYLLSGTRPEERKLWSKFEDMAKAGNMIPRIVGYHWLLDVAMAQELKWDNKYLFDNDE